MKTTILAAFAALSLGTGSAYAAGGPVGFAQGGPVGYQEPGYGAQAFTDHRDTASVHFLGRDTVLGKIFHSDSNQVTTNSSTKG